MFPFLTCLFSLFIKNLANLFSTDVAEADFGQADVKLSRNPKLIRPDCLMPCALAGWTWSPLNCPARGDRKEG